MSLTFSTMAQPFLRKVCLFLFLLCSLSGCLTIHNLNVTSGNSSPPQSGPVAINSMDGGGTSTPVPISEMTAPEAPPALSLGAISPSYTLQPGDHLDVKFFYNKELDDSVIVRPDGRISLQLVHDVQAAFLSPDELVTVLKRKYSTHLKDPEISVIVREIENYKVYVDGEVRDSGGVPIWGDSMAIMQAIASAGGLKDSALKEEVLLIRRNGLKRPFVYLVNLAAAMDGSDISQNVMLKANDIVYVPKSAIANVNTWVDMYIRKNIPIFMNLEPIGVN
jgi:protein involved in polysaccharide export with SLBB domain